MVEKNILYFGTTQDTIQDTLKRHQEHVSTLMFEAKLNGIENVDLWLKCVTEANQH